MSGHSKWAKIKRKKGVNDMKKGALFTKLAKAITMAASEGGSDESMNFTLRLAIDNAKKANMPLVNIERAINKGTGEGNEANQIHKIVYEGVAKGGIALIIICTTDNTNRTVSEIRKIFDNYGASLGSSGSQIWQFDEKGVIRINSAKLKKAEKFGAEDTYEPVSVDEVEMEIIDLNGVEDIERDDDDEVSVYTKKENFAQVHKKIEETGFEIIEAGIRFLSKDMVNVDPEIEQKVIHIVDELEELDDVDDVYTNMMYSNR